MIGKALGRGLVPADVFEGVRDTRVYPGRSRRRRCLNDRLTDQIVLETQRKRVPGRGLEQAEPGHGAQAIEAGAGLNGRRPGKKPEVDRPSDECGDLQQVSGAAIDAGDAVTDDVPHGRRNARARHGFLGQRAPVALSQARELAEAKSTAFYGAASVTGYPTEKACAIIGRPGWQSFAVFDGATIVAVASLHVVDNAGHMFAGATLPEYRGRGAQSALIAARIEAAWSAGCDAVIAEAAAADNPSLHNQQRAGLRSCYERQHWTWRDRKGG